MIPVTRVQAAFRPGHLRYLDDIIALPNLMVPQPFGDLISYTFVKGRSLKQFEASKTFDRVPAVVNVFSSVRGAQKASIAIRDGGECLAHPTKESAPAWSKCSHLRVGNVLLIMSSGIARTPRVMLTAALHSLGPATTS